MTYTDHFISLLIGIAGYFLSIWIHRAWSNLSIKDTERRLKEAETQKAQFDNLSKSDRPLMIHGFQGVFVMIAILCLVFAVQTAMFLHPEPYLYNPLLDYRELAQILLWVLPALVCMGIVVSLQRIAEYPKHLETIEKRIAKLRDKLSGKSGRE